MNNWVKSLVLLASLSASEVFAAGGSEVESGKISMYFWSIGIVSVLTFILYKDFGLALEGKTTLTERIQKLLYGVLGWIVTALVLVVAFNFEYVSLWPDYSSLTEVLLAVSLALLLFMFFCIAIVMVWKAYDREAETKEILAKEEDVLLNHEYDGIRELDNDLPSWWVYLFYLTVAFGVVYLYHYEMGDGNTSHEDYVESMEEAKIAKEKYLAEAGNSIDETNVTLLTDAESIAAGKEVFMTFCQTCHGAAGQGQAGPNLTDQYWLHGDGIKNIFSTVKYGVLDKGMTAWGDIILPLEIQQVSSYIYTLQGTNPDGAKAPEGELVERK